MVSAPVMARLDSSMTHESHNRHVVASKSVTPGAPEVRTEVGVGNNSPLGEFVFNFVGGQDRHTHHTKVQSKLANAW